MKKYLCFCIAALLFVSCVTAGRTEKYPAMLADVDPFSIGSVKASLDETFSTSIKETIVEVIFYPRENEVALEFNNGPALYRQFWGEAGRLQLINALSSYKEDLANQRLITSYNRSRDVYGRFNGRFQWKPFSFSATYKASPVIRLGYRFRNGSPFISASQIKAKEETGINRKGLSESPAYSIYFTLTQGEELAALFDQAYLLGLLR